MTEPTAAAAAAPNTAQPAAPGPAPRKAMALRPQSMKTMTGPSATDRVKSYLKDVPLLHARLTRVVSDQESNLAAAKRALAEFEQVTAQIKATVAKWEEEQSHGRPGHDVTAAPAPAPSGDPGVGPAAAGPGDAPAVSAEPGAKNAC